MYKENTSMDSPCDVFNISYEDFKEDACLVPND